MRSINTVIGSCVLAVAALASTPARASAQWSRTYEQFYMPGSFNWTFRREYAAADRLFNAFDYGHAILYERLYTKPNADVSLLETEEYDFITQKLLVNPPDLPLEEAAIEVNYAKLAPEAKMMFDWAHLLHRQIYDVLASEDMSMSQKDAKIAALVAYYRTRPDVAFSSVPKNMELMEDQPYSLAFRRRYPKFNGLIWGYHWLQVGLYEPLIVGTTREERQSGVTAAVARFRQMLENAPEHMPRIMPMTAAIAPTFAARYPEASIIFDNLHAMHDVVSDILTNNEKVPRGQKRAAILEAAGRYRDATSFAMTTVEWKSMSEMMGVDNMGGPAVGFMAGWPAATVARGASMADAMKGMQHGASPSMPGMTHGADSVPRKAATALMPGMTHEPATDSARIASTMALLEQMMRDPAIRARVMADTAMHRMMMDLEMTHGLPAMMHDTSSAASRVHAPPAAARSALSPTRSTKRPPARKAAASKPAPAKKAPVTPPMDHSKMPGMKMPGTKP